MYFIRIEKSGDLAGIALGPEGRFEDAIDAFKMFSISVFNYAGISVTKMLKPTARAVLDQIRVILIWAVFLIPWGNYLCRVQDYFHWTAPLGLVILICGVWLFNDVIIMPLIRKLTGQSVETSATDVEKEVEK